MVLRIRNSHTIHDCIKCQGSQRQPSETPHFARQRVRRVSKKLTEDCRFLRNAIKEINLTRGKFEGTKLKKLRFSEKYQRLILNQNKQSRFVAVN